MDRSTIYDTLIESLLVLLLVFAPLAHGAVHPWSIAIFEVAAALMAFFWILKMLSRNKSEFIFSPLLALFFILISYSSLQFFFSLPTTIYSWATKTELLKLISYALIFLVTLNTIKTKRQITRILSVIITMGFFMSIFYLMRYFGASAPRGFINSDHFSAYLGMIIPLSLGFLLVPSLSSDTRPSAKPPRKGTTSDIRLLLFFFALIMSAALFFTMSRGGMFSFIAALLFIALIASTRRSWEGKKWILFAVVVFIALIIAWLGATPVIERMLSVKAEIMSRYFGGRLPIWQGTVGIIKDNPIFGTGLGTFNYIFPKYQPVTIIGKHYTYAHSDVILELLSEAGIIGFTLLLACGLWSLVYLFRRFYSRHDPWVVGMSICIFGSLAAIFIHSCADFNLHIPANAILLTYILALSTSILNLDREIQPKAFNMARLRYPVGIFGVALLGLFIIAASRPVIAAHYVLYQNNFKLAVRLDPTNAEYHYQLGKSAAGSAQAIDEYKKAIALNPTNSQYHQSLAWAYGQVPETINLANKHFQEAIELEPSYYYRYYVYALWLFAHPDKENIEKGVIEYKKAVELEPKLSEDAVTEYYRHQKNCEKLIAILPVTEENDYTLLAFLIKEKGLKFAIDFAEKFLKTYPYNAQMHFWIADRSFYDKNYSWEFTEKHYNIAFENEPRNAVYRFWHGIHLFYRREYEKALKDLELALSMGLNPENEKLVREHIAKCKSSIQNKLQENH